ncbi:hypothetical protein B0H19DRAFT_1077535 [Mycena capillaripes]|nr:hypothetical protein B0H19DRAFT_1077535 [Mycena capillaripes]
MGDYRPHLLPRLQKVHLAPMPDEAFFESDADGDEVDAGPWDDEDAWTKLICHHRLSHIHYFILSTPLHLFWPPTHNEVRRMHSQCGYGSEHGRVEAYIEDEPDNVPQGLIEGERSSTYGPGHRGDLSIPALLWARILNDNGDVVWDSDSSGVYCGFAEHLFFDEFRHRGTKTPARKFGHEETLFKKIKFRERSQCGRLRRASESDPWILGLDFAQVESDPRILGTHFVSDGSILT